MDRKYFLKSTLRKSIFARLIAKGIDLFIVLIISVFAYPIGIILSLVYLGVCDSIQKGQSVGKKFIGFSVVSMEDGAYCSIKQSIIRNLPLLIPLLFTLIPILGWIFAVLVGIPLILLEIYLIFKLDSGNRLGDVMADTTVIGSDKMSELIKKGESSLFSSKSNVQES